MIMKDRRFSIMTLALATAISFAGTAQAQTTYKINIAAQPLGSAITELSSKTETVIFAPSDLLKGKTAAAVSGDISAEAALQQMLAGTGLQTNVQEGVIYVTEQAQAEEPVVADDAAKKSRVINEIVVTANKREQSLQDIPMSVVAVNSDELRERNIDNFSDLGFAVPGLSVNDGGDGGGRRIFLRGIGNVSGSSSLIGVYLDEVPLTTNPIFQLDVRAADLERVEVLRGPQGTLYGQGAVGGVVRFITKNPDLDRFGVIADATARFTRGGAPSQRVLGVVNIPIIEDEFALRVVGSFENAGGWIDQPAADQVNINDGNVSEIRVKGLWEPSDALRVTALVQLHRADFGASPIGEDEDGNFTQVFQLTNTPSSEDNFDIYNITAEYDFGSVTLLSASSYINTDKEARNTAGRLLGFDNLLSSVVETEVLSEELRLSSSADGDIRWTLGGFYQDAQLDRSQFEYFDFPGPLPDGPPPFSLINYEQSKAWAVFGDISIKMTDWFEIGGGLRYFEDRRSIVDAVAMVSDKAKFDALSPRVYVQFSPAEDLRIYASAAKGFRSGGFSFDATLPPYGPENTWTYEVGAKFSGLDGALQGAAALFLSKYNDYQIFGLQLPPAPLAATISNGGDTEIKGVEISFEAALTDRLSLSADANYVDTEFVAISPLISSSHTVGDPLDYVPKYQFTISSDYEFDFLGEAVNLRLDYNQKGQSRLINQLIGVDSSSGVVNMLNANLSWQASNNLTMSVFGSNLLNDRDFTDPNAYFEGASRSRPRTLGFNLRYEM